MTCRPGGDLSDESTRNADRWIRLALVAAVLLAFGASVTFDFLVDDRWIIRSNEAIRGWSSLITLWGKPYWTADAAGSAGLYRPLSLFVFAVLWNSGLQFPFWFHLLAVTAHVVATILVWRLLSRGVPRWPAALGALWFAVHPLHIEAVANVANSSEVFVTIATLSLALLLLRTESRAPDEPISWTTALAAGALFAAALLFKESGATAPVLAFVVVWGWRTQSASPTLGVSQGAVANAWRRWNRIAIVCAIVFAAIVLARINALGSLVSRQSIAAEGLGSLTIGARVWAMLALGPKVIELLVWPRVLNPAYGPRFLDGHSGVSAPAVAFLAIGVAVVWGAIALAQRGDRRVAAGIAWATIAFLPASNLLVPTGQILAERTLYLPSVGIILVLATLLSILTARVHSLTANTRRRVEIVAGAATLVAVVGAANTTRHRSWAWHDHDAWYRQLIAANPNDYHDYLELGVYQRKRGQRSEALAAFEHAYQLAPNEPRVLAELAPALMAEGQSARAAAIGAQLMARPERRRDAADVALYLESMGAAFGPDSVSAAVARLRSEAPIIITALYSGLAHEARGERAEALRAYRDGLAAAGTDSPVAMRLRQRVDSLSR